jgi:hypothetical protein
METQTTDHKPARRKRSGAGRAPARRAPAAKLQRSRILRDLVASMMLGQYLGLADDSDVVLRLLTLVVGQSRTLRVGLALASAMGGEIGPARALLAEGLEDAPENEAAVVSLALALKMGGAPEWERLIERILAVSTNVAIRHLALQVRLAPDPFSMRP